MATEPKPGLVMALCCGVRNDDSCRICGSNAVLVLEVGGPLLQEEARERYQRVLRHWGVNTLKLRVRRLHRPCDGTGVGPCCCHRSNDVHDIVADNPLAVEHNRGLPEGRLCGWEEPVPLPKRTG